MQFGVGAFVPAPGAWVLIGVAVEELPGGGVSVSPSGPQHPGIRSSSHCFIVLHSQPAPSCIGISTPVLGHLIGLTPPLPLQYQKPIPPPSRVHLFLVLLIVVFILTLSVSSHATPCAFVFFERELFERFCEMSAVTKRDTPTSKVPAIAANRVSMIKVKHRLQTLSRGRVFCVVAFAYRQVAVVIHKIKCNHHKEHDNSKKSCYDNITHI